MPAPTPPASPTPQPQWVDPAALVDVGRWLQSQRYQFITPTPATHALVLGRRTDATASDLRDIFGWNLPFAESLLPTEWMAKLQRSGLVQAWGAGLQRATVRFSTFGSLLFPHSSFPTTQNESVFFGPDTYRFAGLIRRQLSLRPLQGRSRVLDMGCGSGAGGLVAAIHDRTVSPQLVLADISPLALRFAQASAELANVPHVGFSQGDLFNSVAGDFDLVVANPPYLNDGAQRLYRHGGGRWGEALSIRILREGYPRLAPGGRLVLYTGSSISQGGDHLLQAAEAELAAYPCRWSYEEIDPDVFGDELQNPAYADIDRIAAVGLVVQKP
ncbi:class I SAM-dependent methyltransferase [Acidovorax sp. Leaf78]|uniref:methyltransferase n=1 Tax=unclassified Acidovorax TaxID=2684926 RepID=UPI0009E79C57|nr:class I SAM-dependent methyltransferase [Acidovorax sp. Leaf78]